MSTQDDTAPEGLPPATPEGVVEGSSSTEAPDAGTTAQPEEPEALPEPEPEPAAEPAAEPEALPEPEPRKIVRTTITDAAYDAALGPHPTFTPGRADLVLVIECPESYDEAGITAEAIAADPSITVISRVRPEQPTSEPAAESVPTPEPEVVITDEQIAAINLSSALPDSGAPRAPMKIIRTEITEAAVAALLGKTGREDHVFIVEAPEDMPEDEITADAIASGRVAVVARVPIVTVESTPPQPQPELISEPAADAEPEIAVEAPRKPTKIVRTSITDAAHAEAVRAMGGRAEPGKHDHVVMVEMPEDIDEADLTADRIAQDPEISVVSRVRARPIALIPAGMVGAGQPAPSAQSDDDESPLVAIFNELEGARNAMRAVAVKLKGQGHHEGIVAFQIEELARRLMDQMRYLERETAPKL